MIAHTNVLARLALVIGLGATGTAFAAGHPSPEPREICRDVRAELHELATQENCASPLAFCAAGNISGNFGLVGTTYFTVDGAAATPTQSPGTSAYTGIFVITAPTAADCRMTSLSPANCASSGRRRAAETP